MSRAPLWRALAAFAVIATSLFLAFSTEPRLGLDLRGGTQLVFEARDSPTVTADAEATDRALDVLRRRAGPARGVGSGCGIGAWGGGR